MKKIKDPKTIENLSILIASAVGPGDRVDGIAKKVIDDYFSAKKIVKNYK